jgi:hypothetical protein
MFDTNTSQFKNELPVEEKMSKKTLIIIILVVVLVIGGISFAVFKYLTRPQAPAPVVEIPKEVIPAVLPTEVSTSTDLMATSTIPEEIEKITFADFYKEPVLPTDLKIKDYKLPLNVKIDTLNYHDVSRKFDLSKGLTSLDTNGFTLLDNPAPTEINNFYGAYSFLAKKDIPLLITSDFLLHYHQNTVKQVFKEIEENVFYEHLFKITRALYDSSKTRYEARLAQIGDVNDSVLEGERLAMAYFAVTLKILEPTTTQVDLNSSDPNKFTVKESQGFYFSVLPYLQNDVTEELRLIKEANGVKKSPVLLYQRNYSDFSVPAEYRSNEKLYNFYLASTWLNSNFPLVINDKNCPTCLLDKYDSYINLIAASFITKDFASNQDLKNRWALVYKIISYNKGLRDDLTYLDYDREMKKLFGDNYDPESIFAERNPDKTKNLEKLRTNLLAITFNDFQGAIDKKNDKPKLGFKLLTDYYWPNAYIFNRIQAGLGLYQGEKAKPNNTTVCNNTVLNRCNGSGFDIIGLIRDKLASHDYWMENTNYIGYDQKIATLRSEFSKTLIWHTNRFWSLLGMFQTMFEQNDGQMQIYSQTDSWQRRLVDVAMAAWIDLQLPLETLLPASDDNTGNLSSTSATDDDYYIEPNYYLIQKIIADNEMINGMMEALNVNRQVGSVALLLKDENEKLNKVEVIIKKELNDELLSSDDRAFIGSFAKQYSLIGKPVQQFTSRIDNKYMYESVNMKFMALVYQLGDSKFIAIGPILSFKEGN